MLRSPSCAPLSLVKLDTELVRLVSLTSSSLTDGYGELAEQLQDLEWCFSAKLDSALYITEEVRGAYMYDTEDSDDVVMA